MIENIALTLADKIDLAIRSDLSSDMIEKLAVDEQHYVREAIARREDLSEEIIKKLADDDCFIRKLIAKRKDL